MKPKKTEKKGEGQGYGVAKMATDNTSPHRTLKCQDLIKVYKRL
jgi:hypothetical protein